MLDSAITHPASGRLPAVLRSAMHTILGAALTLGLFLAMARFGQVEPAVAPVEIEDLRMVAMPMEVPPPPRTREAVQVGEGLSPLADIRIAASESPVRIAVVPPELSALLPPAAEIPPARIEVSNLFTEFKPRTEVEVDTRRIYQQTEVDRVPTVLHRSTPWIPNVVRGDAEMLRVTLILVLDTRGNVTSARILRPSGNRYFDRIIADTIRGGWEFTPAVKNGKPVRCMLQQTVTVKWVGGSPFEL